MQTKLLLTIATGAMIAAQAAPAVAQDAASELPVATAPAFGEIVVTARRQSERLQDVPASISVLTNEALERADITNSAEIAQLTPGVTIVTSTAEVGDTQINIRGINGARDAESNVALVVDGILKTNTAQLNQIQGDLQQVEVLKGPQGAYYGRNAAAGAIVMTTKKPGDVLGLNAEATYGENDTYTARATVSGPLSETAGFVLFGDYRKTDGFYRNTGPNPESQGATVDNFEGYNIGGRLVFEPSEALEIDAKVRYGDIEAAALSFNPVFHLPGFAGALGNPDFDEDVNEHSYDFIGNIVPRNFQDTFEASLKGSYDFGWATLTAWTLYSEVSQEWLADSTAATFYRFELQPSCTATREALAAAGYQLPSPQVLLATPFASIFGPFGPTTCDGTQYQKRDQKDWSAEIRLSSSDLGALDWSVGLYYLNIDRETGVAIAEDQGQGGIFNLYNEPGTINPTSLLFWDQFDTDVYAAFGSVGYDVTDTLNVSLALRYDREERNVESLVPNVIDPATGGPINPGLPATGMIAPKSEAYQELQPKVSIAYTPTPDWTIFANWGVGFKAGGFNNQGSNAVIEQNLNIPLGASLLVEDEYRKETSSAFEAGFKGQLFDGRMTIDAAAYYTEVTDMQFFEFYTGGFGLLRVVTNIDEVEIMGLEASSTVRIIDGWDVFGSVNVTDSEIKENASRPNTVGNKSPYTSDYTINLGSQIVAPLNDQLDITLRADWRLTGPTWFHTVQEQDVRTVFDLFFPGLGTANYSKTQRDAFDVFNLRVGIEAENWRLVGFANNLFNDQIIAEVIPAPEFGGSFLAPGALRTLGVEFGVKF